MIAQRVKRFLVARFDRKSQLGLGLTLTVVVFGLAVWTFSGLLAAVLDNQTLVRADIAIEGWIQARTTPAGSAVFSAITQLENPAVNVVVVVVAIYFWRTSNQLLLWNWLGANIGGKVVEHVLKSTVHRSRPHFGTTVLDTESFSFPSGHTMGATVCYLLLASFIASRSPSSSRTPWIALVLAAGLIGAVALSRLYLGRHYPSDVLGGFVAGVAWLAACGAVRRFVAERRVLTD